MNDSPLSHDPEPTLYPESTPRAAGMLAVDALHRLYWEECGAADGVPLLFIHGGPGGGSLPHHRRFYDPAFWRIVLYDQRGAGRSTPAAELTDNTTAHLIDDVERLRRHLGIDKWMLFGGSWGSTLALLYAQAHPERVLGLVLRGIFLATHEEIDWFLHGMARVFPEAWRAFAHFLPPDERADLLGSYYRRLTDANRGVHVAVAAVRVLEIVVGIVGGIGLFAIADFEVACRRAAAIDEVMRIRLAGRIARAIAGAKRLLAGVGDERQLAFQHIDKFVLERVPVPQRRLAACRQRHEIDAESRQAARVAETALHAITHTRPIGLRISGSAPLLDSGGIECGKVQFRHVVPDESQFACRAR